MTRSGLARRAAPSPTTGRRSRTVLTSGGLQPVLDAGGGEHSLGVEQVPDYAPIQFAGHETGDFVLVPRSSQSAAAPSVSP